jgi:hypothetical protein
MRDGILRELNPNFDRQSKRGESAGSPEPPSPWWAKLPMPEPVDLSRRYDVYCLQHGEAVVYRNVMFRAVKGFSAGHDIDAPWLYIELVQEDGKAIFLRSYTIDKFCDPGASAGGEPVPPSKP